MAWFDWYEFEWSPDSQSVDLKLELQQNSLPADSHVNYTGPTPPVAGRVFRNNILSLKHESFNRMKPDLVGSSLGIQFDGEDIWDKDFLSRGLQALSGFRCVLTSGTFNWKGILNPIKTVVQYRHSNPVYTLYFDCGLERADTIQYQDSLSATDTSGYIKVKDVICNCLIQLKHEEDFTFRDYVSISLKSTVTYDSVTDYTYMLDSDLEDSNGDYETIGEILKNICTTFNAQLFQDIDGTWTMKNNNAYWLFNDAKYSYYWDYDVDVSVPSMSKGSKTSFSGRYSIDQDLSEYRLSAYPIIRRVADSGNLQSDGGFTDLAGMGPSSTLSIHGNDRNIYTIDAKYSNISSGTSNGILISSPIGLTGAADTYHIYSESSADANKQTQFTTGGLRNITYDNLWWYGQRTGIDDTGRIYYSHSNWRPSSLYVYYERPHYYDVSGRPNEMPISQSINLITGEITRDGIVAFDNKDDY